MPSRWTSFDGGVHDGGGKGYPVNRSIARSPQPSKTKAVGAERLLARE